MLAATVSLMLAVALGAGAAPRWSVGPRLLAVPALAAAFVVLYLFVSDQVAQDRAEYYRWYQQSAAMFADPDARDRGFSLVLHLLPERMSAQAFGMVLGSTMIVLIIGFVMSLARRGVVPWAALPLVLVVALCDRMFLDITLNSSRSSLATLLFLFGVLRPVTLVRCALWALAWGVHGRILIILVLLYGASRLLALRPRVLWVAAGIGVLAMLVRLASGSSLVPAAATLELFLRLSEAESVARGASTTSDLTPSLAAQVVLALILPLMLLRRRAGPALSAHAAAFPADTLQARLVNLSLLSVAAGLLLYPDLSLAQRIFLVPILCLPLLLPRTALLRLATAKLAILILVLPSTLA